MSGYLDGVNGTRHGFVDTPRYYNGSTPARTAVVCGTCGWPADPELGHGDGCAAADRLPDPRKGRRKVAAR